MKLFYSDASPYARKCAVVAQEKGLGDQIEIDRINVYEMEFREINPLNKIPCLVLPDGTGLFDSFVICDHLPGDARWQAGYAPAQGLVY